MKKLGVLLGILILVIGLSVNSHAALIDWGNGLIYDSDLNVTWVQNANLASQKTFGVSGIEPSGQMGWWTAQSWLAAMNASNYLGYSNWRLPATMPVNGNSFNYAFRADGSTDLGYNISALGSAYPKSKGSELAYMYYIDLGNKGVDDVFGNVQGGYGVSNQGPFVNLANLPAPGYVTTYIIFWSGSPFSGPPQYPGEQDIDVRVGGVDPRVDIEKDFQLFPVSCKSQHPADRFGLGPLRTYPLILSFSMSPRETVSSLDS